jgi:hypothetical protein
MRQSILKGVKNIINALTARGKNMKKPQQGRHREGQGVRAPS